MDETLGDDLAELRDLDLRQYHPRTFIRDQLFGDDDDDRPAAAAPAGRAATSRGRPAALRPRGADPRPCRRDAAAARPRRDAPPPIDAERRP